MKPARLGRIEAERIKNPMVPRPSRELLNAYRSLEDPTGLVSDTLDELGIHGTIGASTLMPTMPGSVVVGVALTLRNVEQRGDPYQRAQLGEIRMAEMEAHNIAQQDDVLVIQGVANLSNMGGISAQVAKRAGEVGAIVDGGIRDVAHQRRVGFPVWATHINSVTGKWRIETREINGVVRIQGVSVSPGDLVVADDTAVCFVPRDRVEEVLKRAQARASHESMVCQGLDEGKPLHELFPSFGR